MKLEEIFRTDLDKDMAKEIIKKLKKTNGRKGIKYTDLEMYLRDTLGTDIFFNSYGVVNTLMEEGYVARKKFNKKNFKEDLKEKGKHNLLSLEIPRYYLTRKGKRLYKKIC